MKRVEQDRIMLALDALFDREHVYRDPDLTMESVAARVGSSPRTLSRLVAIQYGYSFPTWLNDWRVRYAAEQLLAQPERSVAEIMFDAGFGSKSTFHREFSRVFAMTPTAYRARRGIAKPM